MGLLRPRAEAMVFARRNVLNPLYTSAEGAWIPAQECVRHAAGRVVSARSLLRVEVSVFCPV